MSFSLNAEEKKLLLAEARESISAKLENRKPNFAPASDASVLAMPCGAFVTLKTRVTGKLRGCIGRMNSPDPLQKTVRIMALEAAFSDPRFPPLEAGELPIISIEISALSPMQVCEDASSVKVGVHGLYLFHRGRSGVLLPQVPVEQGWDRDQYLEYICIKAGLPPGSYQAPGAELYTFTALVFGEED